MATDPQLEAYLASLDKALNSISVSERAEIVTEIKSHVLEARGRDSSQSVSSILSALGDPEAVANRFLLERGLKPGKPAKSPMVKWLTIGFLGTIGLFFLMLVFLIVKFSPLIEVDDNSERVALLGGMIKVDGKAGHLKIGDIDINGSVDLKGEGHYDFSGMKVLPASVETIHIPFSNGKFEVTNGPKLTWKCKVAGPANNAKVAETEKEVAFDFTHSAGVKCEIEVPSGKKVDIKGDNGKISVDKPQGNLSVALVNGVVRIAPDPARRYSFDTDVHVGKVDDFESSKAPDAIRVDVKLTNGKIERE